MCPVNAGGDPGAATAEVTLYAVSIQIMTGAAIKRARTVKSGLIFVDPGLPQIVNVAVVATCRIISKRSVQIMTAATGFVFRGQTWIIVRRFAMVPDYARRNLGAGRPEVALGAVSIQIMTGGTIKRACAMEIGLVFIEPRLPGWMGMAVMAAYRIISERTIKIMAGCTSIVGFNKDLIIMGDLAMCPVNARGHLAAVGA